VVDDSHPGGIQLPCRCRRAATRDFVRLLDQRGADLLLKRDVSHGHEVGRANPAPGAVTQNKGRSRFRDSVHVRLRRSMWRGHLYGCHDQIVAVSCRGRASSAAKRKLYKGRTYRVTLVVPGGSDSDLFVWEPGTKEIWQFPKLQRRSATVGSADEVVKFKAGSTVIYYFHVMVWVHEEGGYILKIVKIG
jgi:hypothetical protein